MIDSFYFSGNKDIFIKFLLELKKKVFPNLNIPDVPSIRLPVKSNSFLLLIEDLFIIKYMQVNKSCKSIVFIIQSWWSIPFSSLQTSLFPCKKFKIKQNITSELQLPNKLNM